MSFKTTPYDSVCTVRIGRSLDSPNVEKLEGSTSGVMIDAKHGLVLTHAFILNQLVQKLRPGKLEMLRKSGSVRGPFFEDKMNVEIILPNCNDIESVLAENKNRNDVESHIQPSFLNGSAQDTQSFSKYKGTMKMIFECRNLRRTIESTLPSDNWQFADESNNELAGKTEENHNKKTGNHEDVAFLLLPSFVLFRLKDFQPSKQSLSIRNAGSNRQGDPVEICATPFGGLSPEVFLNSRSQGIISNLAGPRGVLIMTDARCVPGSEGGALFYCGHGQRQLTGIMIASLCWKNSEWVGLSMACAMSELMGSLQGYMTLDNDQQMTAPTFTGSYGSKFAEELGRFLAYVRVGNSWGSAVAISPADGTYLIHADVYNFTLGSKFAEDLGRFLAYVHVGNSWGSAVAISPADGTYLTCSHVLNGMESQGVSISGNDANQQLQCQVVYRTPGHSHFDLAVIKRLDNSNLKHRLAPVQFGKAQEGEVVYVVGHALFRSDHHLAPTVTRGIVSKVVRFNNVPVIMMTTCAVHAGASGGGVFNRHGQLVAIAVCNSKDTSSGACYPHVNMCVPMETIAPVIRQYLKTNDPSILKNLRIENKRVNQMWNIGTERTNGVLERVPSAGSSIRNKPKGTPLRGQHPNSSPVYKTQSESSLTSRLNNLSINDDKGITRRASSSKSSNGNVRTLTDVASLLQSETVKNVVLVAGAGISTPSGIPDFRSPGTGLYDNLQQYQIPYPEAIFDIDYFHVNPRPFFTLAKELYPSGKYRPNYIHYFARLLYDKGMLLRMYTQNIDGLERLAGLPAEKLVEAHGTFASATCTVCRQKMPGSDIKDKIFTDKLPRCPTRGCVGIVKPDIVFFGEDLPRKFYSYMKDMLQTDLVIVLGTSLEVQPFAGIVDTVRWNVPRVLFNREAVGPFRDNRRTKDVVAAGDLIDSMVKFSTMIGWKEDMVNLITKEEGEFKIESRLPPIQKKVSFDAKTGKKINCPTPKNPNPNQRNYSSLAYQRRAMFSNDSSSEESSDSDSDVTSSDSSDQEVNRLRKFKGFTRGKFNNNNNNTLKNGANAGGIRNGFRSSSAKLGDPNTGTRRLHTETNSKGARTVNGSLTGRSVKSESGLNENVAKRRLDQKPQNKGQEVNLSKNVSVSEKNRVLRKYGLSPGPAPKTTNNMMDNMQKPVRGFVKNGKNSIREKKAKPSLLTKRTEETKVSDGNSCEINAIKNDLPETNGVVENDLSQTDGVVRNQSLSQTDGVVRNQSLSQTDGVFQNQSLSQTDVVVLNQSEQTSSVDVDQTKNSQNEVEPDRQLIKLKREKYEHIRVQPIKVEIGIRKESPLTDFKRENSVVPVSGYFIDDVKTAVSSQQDNRGQETNGFHIAQNYCQETNDIDTVQSYNTTDPVVSQNVSDERPNGEFVQDGSLSENMSVVYGLLEDSKLKNRAANYRESLEKNSVKFDDTVSVNSDGTPKHMSNRVANSFAKFANIQSQRRVVGRGGGKPHRKPHHKPPTGKNTSPLTDLSKLNARPYGYAYRQKIPVRGIGPFHRIDVRTLNSSMDFTQEVRSGSAELPKLNYRHKPEPVDAFDARVLGLRVPGESDGDTSDFR